MEGEALAMEANTERMQLYKAVGSKERPEEASLLPLRPWQLQSEVKRTARRQAIERELSKLRNAKL